MLLVGEASVGTRPRSWDQNFQECGVRGCRSKICAAGFVCGRGFVGRMVLRAFPDDESQSTRICAWGRQFEMVVRKERRSYLFWVTDLLSE
jgi:hypothetical protein